MEVKVFTPLVWCVDRKDLSVRLKTSPQLSLVKNMATYDAVVSLLKDLEQHLSPYNFIFRWSEEKISPFMKEMEILYDAVSLMDSLLRDSSGLSYKHGFVDQMMENRITSLARKAGNHVDFLAVEYSKFPFSWEGMVGIAIDGASLAQITQEMIAINQELQKIDHSSSLDKPSSCLSPLIRTAPNAKGKLVGLENDLVTMLDSLTGQPLQLTVFSIIGMAGLGKTTFSNKLYHNPLVLHHFYVRAWVTISQQYQLREILLGVLRCVTNDDSDEIHGKSNEELREKVYRSLKHKRYLLVLDDMWDTTAWDDLKMIFPDDKNGSRIILTSRNRDVALHASGDMPPHFLRCLNRHESWELLVSKIFVDDESCPEELVDIGKKIAYKCHGLPLSIVVVGGLLSKLTKKLDVWEEVAQSVGSMVMEEVDHCQYVLALSYNHLPDYVKPCFLYMGMFPQNYEISVKELLWMWVAEGFIRPTTLKSLEEVAEDYLADLIARSLILVKRRCSDGRIKTCYIHDLMGELCLRESQKLNFLQVINNCGQLPLIDTDLPRYDVPLEILVLLLQVKHHLHDAFPHDLRRLSFHSSIHEYNNKTALPYTRSLMCFEKLSVSNHHSFLSMSLKLLKVLNIININLAQIPGQILILTKLKFLALTAQGTFNINMLGNFSFLQTLIIDCEWNGHLTSIFWDMLELRHFHLKRSSQSTSSIYSGSSQSPSPFAPAPLTTLNNLKSVSTLRPISCTENIFRSMSHLKSLGVYESEEDGEFRGWFKMLIHLPELEKLKYIFSNPFVSSVLKPDRLPPWHSFPPKLVKLTLSGTSLPWDDMYSLSLLPKLEVLKLRNYAFSGALWKSRGGGFHCLKFLLIGSTNLETWETDGTHFPNLQHLVLRHCRFLKEIPYSIGEAPLLETIELHRCKNSAVISARNLQEEQQSIGNDGLTIYITEG